MTQGQLLYDCVTPSTATTVLMRDRDESEIARIWPNIIGHVQRRPLVTRASTQIYLSGFGLRYPQKKGLPRLPLLGMLGSYAGMAHKNLTMECLLTSFYRRPISQRLRVSRIPSNSTRHAQKICTPCHHGSCRLYHHLRYRSTEEHHG